MQGDAISFLVNAARLIDRLRLQLGIAENVPAPVEKGILTSYEDCSTDID